MCRSNCFVTELHAYAEGLGRIAIQSYSTTRDCDKPEKRHNKECDPECTHYWCDWCSQELFDVGYKTANGHTKKCPSVVAWAALNPRRLI